MISSLLTYAALVLALAGVAALFFGRFPAVAAAYAALVCARLAGAPYVTSDVLIFWGVAAALVLGLRYLMPPAAAGSAGRRYVAAGALAGAVVGYACTPASATIVFGSMAGAFLGAVAYMTTPASPRHSPGSAQFLNFLCAAGLPAAVTCSTAVITAATLLG